MTRIVVLVPAYCEEAQLAATLDSLLIQDSPIHKIVVIPNTSTGSIEDRTAIIGREYSRAHPQIEVHELTFNKHKKSGAMNYGWLWCNDADFVFTMDADTILFADTISGMLAEFDDPEVGATCARYWAKAGRGMAWELQRIEYARYDDARELRNWKVTVASGAAVMYRKDALDLLLKKTGQPFPWDNNSLIEDYCLTLDIREMGWKVVAARGAHVLTDTPQNFRDLWDQRQRWGRGGFEEVRKRGFRKFLLYDITGYGVFATNILLRLMCSIYFMLLMIVSDAFTFTLIGMIPLIVVWLSRVTSYLRLNGKTIKDAALVGCVLIEDLYGLFLEICTAISIARSIRTSTPRVW